MRTYFFTLLLCLLSPFLRAQSGFGFQQEYFFGRLPSGQAEAMGGGQVAVGGSVASLFFNPAGLGLIQTQEAMFSTSAPFYALTESDYYFAGVARRFHPNMVGALSVNQFAVGPSTFDITINGQRYPVDEPKSTNVALSYAVEPIEGLHVGTNVNYYHWKYLDEVEAATQLHVDVGALYRLALQEGEKGASHLQIGAAVNNLSAARIEFSGPAGEVSSNEFPSIVRVGASFLTQQAVDFSLLGLMNIGFTGTLEYQAVLNNPFRNGIRIGTETVLWEVLAVRLGFFTHSIDDFGFPNNRSQLTDFTHGLGLIIPLPKLTDAKIPFSFHIDYVGMKQPPFTFSGPRLVNMRTFSFRLVWVGK
jgi:hypothetical protein